MKAVVEPQNRPRKSKSKRNHPPSSPYSTPQIASWHGHTGAKPRSAADPQVGPSPSKASSPTRVAGRVVDCSSAGRHPCRGSQHALRMPLRKCNPTPSGAPKSTERKGTAKVLEVTVGPRLESRSPRTSDNQEISGVYFSFSTKRSSPVHRNLRTEPIWGDSPPSPQSWYPQPGILLTENAIFFSKTTKNIPEKEVVTCPSSFMNLEGGTGWITAVCI